VLLPKAQSFSKACNCNYKLRRMNAVDRILAVLSGQERAPPSRFLTLTSVQSEDFAIICSALEHSKYAGGLHISRSCCIGDAGAVALGKALTKNKALESLELPGCRILHTTPTEHDPGIVKNIKHFHNNLCTTSSLSGILAQGMTSTLTDSKHFLRH